MNIEPLIQSVQFNCDLSDREFATDYTICIYLIRMREYYRWAHDIAPNQPLEQSALMEWVSDTEKHWADLEADDFQSLELDGQQYSPFDISAINQTLHPMGLTYSAGYGRFSKPIFMLAELESVEQNEQHSLVIAGKELARELAAPPATMQARSILIRSEAVARLIWDLLEEWQWKKPDNAMAEVVKYYEFERQPERALAQASLDQREVLILHELGELVAEDLVAPQWNELLSDNHQHRHLFARAVRDYLADCVSTLPGLLSEDNIPCLHFYFANLTPMRKTMFPSLTQAYQKWREGGSAMLLKHAIQTGQDHWLKIANQLTDEYISDQPVSDQPLAHYLERHAL